MTEGKRRIREKDKPPIKLKGKHLPQKGCHLSSSKNVGKRRQDPLRIELYQKKNPSDEGQWENRHKKKKKKFL